MKARSDLSNIYLSPFPPYRIRKGAPTGLPQPLGDCAQHLYEHRLRAQFTNTSPVIFTNTSSPVEASTWYHHPYAITRSYINIDIINTCIQNIIL